MVCFLFKSEQQPFNITPCGVLHFSVIYSLEKVFHAFKKESFYFLQPINRSLFSKISDWSLLIQTSVNFIKFLTRKCVHKASSPPTLEPPEVLILMLKKLDVDNL